MWGRKTLDYWTGRGLTIFDINRTIDLVESAKMNNSLSLDNTMQMGRNKELCWGFELSIGGHLPCP